MLRALKDDDEKQATAKAKTSPGCISRVETDTIETMRNSRAFGLGNQWRLSIECN